MSDLVVAIILGIVEGLTEFIPVSSTGHLILAGEVLNYVGEKAATFEIVIQLGAIMAAVWVYRDRFLELFGLKREPGTSFPAIRQLVFPEKKLGLFHIAVAVIPVLLIGFIFHKVIKEHLFSSATVIIGLIWLGIVMVFIDKIKPKITKKSLDELTWKDAIIIGIGQCFSLWPGTSRSGATIISGIFAGVSQRTAADFSFIIAVPALIAATGYDFLKNYHLFSSDDLLLLLVGLVVSFIVAIIAIKWFLNILGKVSLMPFGVYRILVGIVAYFVLVR